MPDRSGSSGTRPPAVMRQLPAVVSAAGRWPVRTLAGPCRRCDSVPPSRRTASEGKEKETTVKLATGHDAGQSLKQEPTVGLPLVIGSAWLAGTLQAIASETAWDPRRADYIIGSSRDTTRAALRRSIAARSDAGAGGRAVGARRWQEYCAGVGISELRCAMKRIWTRGFAGFPGFRVGSGSPSAFPTLCGSSPWRNDHSGDLMSLVGVDARLSVAIRTRAVTDRLHRVALPTRNELAVKTLGRRIPGRKEGLVSDPEVDSCLARRSWTPIRRCSLID